MSEPGDDAFLSGVIEGFYGQPWTAAERAHLFETMVREGLDTYVYTPKDDLKLRSAWREPYTQAEAQDFASLIKACSSRGLRFVFGLSPGLDIRYSDSADLEALRSRFEQMLGLGCRDFALLFDDIPDRIDAVDLQRWGSLAAAQASVGNRLFRWLREISPRSRFLFCPTPYCGRMASRSLGGSGYLTTLGRELLPAIDIFWTGPEIISPEITVEHVRELAGILGRKPLIWDNLLANDYDGRRFFCGPYSGRPRELRRETSGLLINPNTEYPLNSIAVRSLGRFVSGEGEWNARGEYLAAMEAWRRNFDTVGGEVELADLVLFGDCHYLPHEDGATAASFFDQVKRVLTAGVGATGEDLDSFRLNAARLKAFCARTPDVRERALFHALCRRVWELREELDLLQRFVEAQQSPSTGMTSPNFDFHLPGTYRGGFVARLQQMLVQHPDGTFSVSHE